MTDWLPPLVLFEDYDGDWHSYEDALYEVFCMDFLYSPPSLDGQPIRLKRLPLFKDKEATFWHLIGEGPEEAERNPDFRRCERIRWPRAIIDSARTRGLMCWENTRKGERRVVIALPDFSYIVVLADRKSYLLVWTAYCVKHQHQRRKLEQECRENKI